MNHNEYQKKKVGARIRLIRNELGLTMKEFGKKFSPPASDSIVSRWERGVSLPNNERLERISELGNISMFYLTTGKKDLLDLTDEEKEEVGQRIGMRSHLKEELKQLIDAELHFLEARYLEYVLHFLRISDTQDIIGITSIIDSLIRSIEYKNTNNVDKDELNEFLKRELNDNTKVLQDYFFH